MADSMSARKSGRQRIPNKKYSNDAFEVLNVVLSSDSEDEEILQQQQLLQDDSDEFPANEAADDPEEEESVIGDASDGSEILTPVEEYEDAHSYASSDGRESLSAIEATGIKAKNHNAHRDVNSRSRGMPENPLRKDLTQNIARIFTGEGLEDISHIVRSRDQWATEPTLPRRSRLCHLISHTEKKRQMEATVGWDWYYDQGGRESFARKQSVRGLATDEAIHYTGPITASQDFLMGPYGRQQKFSLASSRALDLDQGFIAAEDGGPQPKRRRHGWMLNVGTRVKCMDWVPNRNGNTQYLALATAQSSKHETTKGSPAFTPSSSPSGIQIWVFSTIKGTEYSDCILDSNNPPCLRTVLCSDWGAVEQLKWCPTPRDTRIGSTTLAGSSSSLASIGLLAGVWSDGLVRVLDVQIDQNHGAPTLTQAMKYDSAAFAAHPPAGALSTCLAWLSASDLAIGYSNGHLAIYDICPEANSQTSENFDEDTLQEPRTEKRADSSPWLSFPLHSTYILSLATAYPTHPYLLVSSSLSGHLRLTSLLAPTTDYVISARTRYPPSSLAYCDPLLSVLGPEESSETIKVWGLRCFHASIACGKLPCPPGPGNGIVDAGKCHSSVATGGTDGSVMVTNPMRKILGKSGVGYQQCIFKHEWRSTAVERGNEGQRLGTSRITEGYVVEKDGLEVRKSLRGKYRDNVSNTIYEQETAVTALAWNPNVRCGGWLAAGWGSGLVRVQEVAL